MTKQSGNKIYRKWYFWAGIASILALGILLLAICFNSFNSTREITICTKMDYHGDIGPCIEYKKVEIVANPENKSGCPIDTEPVYDVVGGIVGIRFVGCTKSQQ